MLPQSDRGRIATKRTGHPARVAAPRLIPGAFAMTRAVAVLAGLLLAAPLAAQQAQQPKPQLTADQVIARYQQRVGGMARLQAIQTLRRSGKYYAPGGLEIAFRQENKRPNKVRTSFTLQGMTAVVAYDGTSGWKVQPFGGKKDAEAVGEDELKGLVEDAAFDDPLFDYKRKGNTVELVGLDQIEGTPVYKLKATIAASGAVRTYYIDADQFVPIRIDVKLTIRGAERESQTNLGDYKEVGGVYYPFAQEVSQKGMPFVGRLVWQRIDANVPLDDGLFVRPAAGATPVFEPVVLDTTPPRARVAATPSKPAVAPVAPRAAPGEVVRVDSVTISGLGARNIGSAAMSGRISAVAAVHEGKRLTVYVGAASGGVWKSTNGGTTFKPVFDDEPVQSIGAITVDPTNPKVVWVGTGETWVRNSVSIGDGLYRSTDAGATWTNVGLKESERIQRILVDPTSPSTVYVCVPGKLWSDSDERGVYKTTDGGKTWSKVLAGTNRSTGCSELSMDASHPGTLYAGMWDFRRKGWTFRSGGDGPDAPSGSGLFKSTDGGATWSPLDEKSAQGLPPKPWGRVAVTVAPSKPDVVYALIEAVPPRNALYRSDDGGKTWRMRDRSQDMIWRPFYFATLIVDPKNENRLYKPDLGLIVSNDGGASFSNISGGAHGDFHDVWVDPENTDHLITGDDGGLWYSYDSGDKWWKADNLPISQFYHVSVDMERPYNVYGGLQDNSSWVGPSRYPGGITNARWENMYGGDGFWMFPDPTDPDYLYAESQGGYIGRVNRRTHETRDIKPLPLYGEGKLRFNWNAPIHVSPTQKGTIYLGAQFLFRSRDFGQTWERISPDLSTGDPQKQKQELSGGVTVDNSSAEMHTTIYAIAESPRDPQVIWVGTDDGNVQVTRDGGKSWTNVTGGVPDLPKDAWVSSVEAGHFDAGVAYVTFDLHMTGDMRPYAYRTADYGKSWQPLIPAASPVRGYAHVIKEDLVNPALLFLGTEVGLYVSVDGGQQWSRYKGGDLPSVAVRDLAIHPRDNDLVIATHGRGIWIVDDITPLRALTPATLAQRVAFVQPTPAVQELPAGGGWSNGDATFVGPNPPGDAVITYYMRFRHVFGDMKLGVYDSTGALLATLPTSKRPGLTRITWSMRLPGPRVPPAATMAGGAILGPRFLPGTYTLRLDEGGQEFTAPLHVVADPRSTHTLAERRAQFELARKLAGMLNDMTDVVERMNRLRGALDARAGSAGLPDSVKARLRLASSTVDSLRKKIVATKEGGMITGEERLRENLAELYGSVVGYEGPPAQTQLERADAIAREMKDVTDQLDGWQGKELVALNALLAASKVAPIEVAGQKAAPSR